MKSIKLLPEGYKEIYSVDMQNDKKMMVLINLIAIVLSLVLVIPMHFVVPIFTLFNMDNGIGNYFIRFVVLMVLMIVYLVLHELVHGIAMKMCGTEKVQYGFTGTYAFAKSDDYYNKKDYIVLEAVIELVQGDEEQIREVMADYKNRRVEKQPLEYPSAGSTFKRPEGYFAGKLIQDAELRGYAVGVAQVSEKHCGFVVNKVNATAADVCNLINDVKRIVYEKFQVEMEPEVKMIGEF